jgi:hypothetical protein
MPTFDTPAPVTVTLDLVVADVRIVASDRTDTVVEIRPSDPLRASDVAAAEQTTVDHAHGTLCVKAPKGWRHWMPWAGRESIDVRIEVPTGSPVHGSGAVATLRCSGRIGECRYTTSAGAIHLDESGPVVLHTSAGDIDVGHVTGSADLRTAAGTIRAGAVDGTAVIRTSHGETAIEDVTGDLRVNVALGSIRVGRAGASVVAKTSMGDITIGEVARGAVAAETARGSVDIGVRQGLAAWLDLHTHLGTARSDLEVGGPPSPGEDSIEVRARTALGDITIRRVAASRTEA